MKKLIVLGMLAGLPLLAVAAPDAGSGPMQGGPGMGGQGMGGHGMGMGHGAHPPGPPPEFRTACQGKKAGDRVTVNTPRGPLQGSCELMFRPDGPPPGQRPQQDGASPDGRSAQKPAPR